MESYTKKVVTTQNVIYVVIEGVEFEARIIKELLEQLYDTDFYFNSLVMDDDELEDILFSLDVILKSVRGSVAKGKKYLAFVKDFYDATGIEISNDSLR